MSRQWMHYEAAWCTRYKKNRSKMIDWFVVFVFVFSQKCCLNFAKDECDIDRPPVDFCAGKYNGYYCRDTQVKKKTKKQKQRRVRFHHNTYKRCSCVVKVAQRRNRQTVLVIKYDMKRRLIIRLDDIFCLKRSWLYHKAKS